MSQKKIFSKFTIVCWAAFMVILGHMQLMGGGLDTPDDKIYLAHGSPMAAGL